MTGSIERAAWIAAVAMIGSAVLLAWSMHRSADRIAETMRQGPSQHAMGTHIDGSLAVRLEQGDKPLVVSMAQRRSSEELEGLRDSFINVLRHRTAGPANGVQVTGSQYNAEEDRFFVSGTLKTAEGTEQPFVCTLTSDGFGGYVGDVRHDGTVLHAGVRIP
jgi:hypothetical protein